VRPADSGFLGSAEDRHADLAQLKAELPGLLDYHESGGTGIHETPTVDFEVVLEGELTLELDDGATVELGPGDTVVQNGTRHRWINRGAEPASFAVFMSGARHAHVEYQARPA
jgi:quercetin dioxygenase-like cupin family protein